MLTEGQPVLVSGASQHQPIDVPGWAVPCCGDWPMHRTMSHRTPDATDLDASSTLAAVTAKIGPADNH